MVHATSTEKDVRPLHLIPKKARTARSNGIWPGVILILGRAMWRGVEALGYSSKSCLRCRNAGVKETTVEWRWL